MPGERREVEERGPVRGIRIIYSDGRPPCLVYGPTAADETMGYVRLYMSGRVEAAFRAKDIVRWEKLR
jgi:hypothetical protein